MNTHQEKVIQRVTECMAIANQSMFANQLPRPIYRVPDVHFNIRGKTAGMALLQRWQLRFNPVLLAENPQAFFQEVVPHEISHLIVFAQFGRVRPHGKEWQSLMVKLFKVSPKTTHSFDISSVQGTVFAYKCECNHIQLSIRRHNKVLRQQVQYYCRRCNSRLIWNK